jgi:site-specific DNA-methyltransferase (cytosine-N4-specific)
MKRRRCNVIRIYHGDALERLRGMADGSMNCIVTSPPYWGLRDYGGRATLYAGRGGLAERLCAGCGMAGG